MGNFQEVTVGAGTLSINGVDVGFLKGPVNVSLGHEKLQLKTGVPRKLQGSVITEMLHKIEAPLVQLSADSLSKASGYVPVTTVAGVQVTIADGDDQARTFAAYNGGAVQAIILDGPTVVALTVKSVDELTTYVVNDDYILDADLGIVYRNPGGAIPAGATVHVDYKYTPAASKKLMIGAAWKVLDLSNVLFTHTRPNGKTFTAKMWKAQAVGNVDLDFSTDANDFIMTKFSCEAIDDTANHPSSPLGEWADQQ